MMSDEEKSGESYVRHQPSYRSERFNKFIQKLDERLENMPSQHPRHTRVLGSPVAKAIPQNAMTWMLAPDSQPPLTEDQETGGEASPTEVESDELLFSDSESD